MAASLSLESAESVNALVCGEVAGYDAVAVLTDGDLVVANARPFAPEVVRLGRADVLDVKGWIESNRATLQITATGDRTIVIGEIREVETAQKLAGDLRSGG